MAAMANPTVPVAAASCARTWTPALDAVVRRALAPDARGPLRPRGRLRPRPQRAAGALGRRARRRGGGQLRARAVPGGVRRAAPAHLRRSPPARACAARPPRRCPGASAPSPLRGHGVLGHRALLPAAEAAPARLRLRGHRAAGELYRRAGLDARPAPTAVLAPGVASSPVPPARASRGRALGAGRGRAGTGGRHGGRHGVLPEGPAGAAPASGLSEAGGPPHHGGPHHPPSARAPAARLPGLLAAASARPTPRPRPRRPTALRQWRSAGGAEGGG